MKIETIHNYINDQKSFGSIVIQAYLLSKSLNIPYPGYRRWFFDIHAKGCATKERNLLFIRNEEDEIIAISALKKTKEEKKICTLFVDSKYRNQGIGKYLVEESLKYLETLKPFITFREEQIEYFNTFIEKYDWDLTEVVEDMYIPGEKELCFNGKVLKDMKSDKLLVKKR